MATHSNLSQRSLVRLVRLLKQRRAAASEMVEAFSEEAREAHLTADKSDRFDNESPIGTCNDESFALAANAYALVMQIDAALERLESGGYGFCLECGDGIPFRRLWAVPATTMCFECCERTKGRLDRVVSERISA